MCNNIIVFKSKKNVNINIIITNSIISSYVLINYIKNKIVVSATESILYCYLLLWSNTI